MSGPLHAGDDNCCPCCGRWDATSFVDGGPGGFAWLRCPCGLVFKKRAPSSPAAEIGDRHHYGGDYFARYGRRRRRRIAKSRRQILDALEVAPKGRLLDVGCSLGYALEAARSLGLDAAGVDVAEEAVEACRRLGFDARKGTLGALPFEDGSFAVVVMKHVFEHTPAPRDALGELKRVLAPGGVVFFAVPNVEYRPAARSPSTSRFYRGEAGEAHHVYYSPRTLAALLEREGFRVDAVHPRLVHRRAGFLRFVLEAAVALPRIPARAVADALGLRKEFWLVAVRL